MAVYMKQVPDEDWEILKKYFEGDAGYILVPECVSRQLSEEQQLQLQELEGERLDYTFGDEADVWVDIVQSPDHYFTSHFLPEQTENLEMEGM